MLSLQPKKRNNLRNFLGKKYFRLKRYIEWLNDIGNCYAAS